MSSVPVITAAQWEALFRQALLKRTKDYDTAYGPIKPLFLEGPARVLEDQNNRRLRKVSLLRSLENVNEFDDEDMDSIAFNEGLFRPDGSRSTVDLTFRRNTPFGGANGNIPIGTAIGTAVDSSSGAIVIVATTAEKDAGDAVPVSEDGVVYYDVTVPAVSLTIGTGGIVGAGRLTRPLRTLGDYDSVTNKSASQLATDRFDNEDLKELCLLAVSSRQLSVPRGSEFNTIQAFSAVTDVYEAYGSDPLVTRAGSDAGAVDAFVIGETASTVTEAHTFYGHSQKVYLNNTPVISVVSVTLDSTPLTVDEDYEVVLDTTGVSGSVRARDAIRILPGVTATIGDGISIEYQYNTLIPALQASAADPKTNVEGRDLLYRMGAEVTIYLTARLKTLSGFTPSDIKALVSTALVDYINSLGLGAKRPNQLSPSNAVEIFDLNAQVTQISGVDNFTITRLDRTAAGTAATDLELLGNEYPRITTATLSITLV